MSPPSLTSVLRDTEHSSATNRAYSLLNDPNASGEIKKMAEEMIRMSRSAEMRLAINADNRLVRDLADLVRRDSRNDDAREIMLGLYNAAILSNQRAMTPRNARIFADQFYQLMARVLSSAQQAAEIQREREILEREKADQRMKANARDEHSHVVCFHVTPYDPPFSEVRHVIEDVIERELHCELRSADQRKYERWIAANVHAHIRDADFFVVDLTGLKWNVMIELGAIDFGRRSQPVIYIAQVDQPGDRVPLPSDVAGLIVSPYTRGASADELANCLRSAIRSDVALNALLERPMRDPYISPGLLHTWTGYTIADEKLRIALSGAFPTLSAWRNADLDDVRRLLGGGRLAALAEITRAAVVEEGTKLYA